MRFQAPARKDVDPARFDHPIFAGYQRHRDLLTGADWPPLDELNRRMAAVDPGIRFVRQDRQLLEDGLHYERRVAERGQVATREDNWHDLLNALVWIEQPQLKRAVNARQVADLGAAGHGQRTRAQCALTHFDEAGLIVVLPSDASLAAWDRHDWPALFSDQDWPSRIGLTVLGHALLEHALLADAAPVGKCLVVAGTPARQRSAELMAQPIASARVLVDPQELRPLPLIGILGWHPRAGQQDFYDTHPCFRPIRAGRHYPAPIPLDSDRRGRDPDSPAES